MHFAEDQTESSLFIRHYDGQSIQTQDKSYNHAIVLFKDQIIEDLIPHSADALSLEHFRKLADFSPELIILGTGAKQYFPIAALQEPLFKKRIGLEIMATDAACRTFNLLLSEGRTVLAALFI